METIAIVDDKADMRQTVARLVRLELAERGIDWQVVESAPLADIDEYLSWIQENEICVLVLDENLSEDHPPGEDAVSYPGHAVASLLRKQKPELPQFIITSIVDASQELEAAEGDLEAVIRRGDFDRSYATYVQRMVRAGQSFVARYESELSELTRIAEAIVSDTATDADFKTADAIRAKMQLAYDMNDLQAMQQWLAKADEATSSLEESVEKLATSIGKPHKP